MDESSNKQGFACAGQHMCMQPSHRSYSSFSSKDGGLHTHLNDEVWAALGQLLQLSGPLLHVLCCLLDLRSADLRTFTSSCEAVRSAR